MAVNLQETRLPETQDSNLSNFTSNLKRQRQMSFSIQTKTPLKKTGKNRIALKKPDSTTEFF